MSKMYRKRSDIFCENYNINTRDFSIKCTKGLFIRTVTVTVTVSVTITVPVYHCANGKELFDRQIGYRTHSLHQMVRHRSYNLNLTATNMDPVRMTTR